MVYRFCTVRLAHKGNNIISSWSRHKGFLYLTKNKNEIVIIIKTVFDKHEHSIHNSVRTLRRIKFIQKNTTVKYNDEEEYDD